VGIPPIGFVFSVLFDSATPDSPFKDARVRQAVEYAIDKVAMTQGIGLGTQFPAYQFAISPPVGQDPWYLPDQPKREFNVAKAKQLLTEAGYPNGFTYPLVSDVRIRQDQVVAIQTYLKAVGINTTLDMADVTRAASFGKDGWKGLLVPGFPYFSSFTQWLAVFDDPVMTNPSMYYPAGWKAGWDAVPAEIDNAKRVAMMRTLLKQAYDEAIQIPYLQDGPRYVTDGTIMDMKWDVPGVNGGYDAVNVWLKKK
jgi:ABC-type transport system substrate-binding protein